MIEYNKDIRGLTYVAIVIMRVWLSFRFFFTFPIFEEIYTLHSVIFRIPNFLATKIWYDQKFWPCFYTTKNLALHYAQ